MNATRWGSRDLTDALAMLRREEACIETPSRVESAVLAAWDRDRAARRAERRRALRHRAAATAAAVAITVGLVQLGRVFHQTARTPGAPVGDTRTLLVVGEPILQGEPVRVVRMRVPVSTLTELGVRPATGSTASHVDLDVIVGEDGIARAIRVGM
jgi:hypothetical protein